MAPTRVALVTGCGKPDGMGNAIALRLAGAGYDLVVTDRAATGVANIGERTSEHGGIEALAAELRALGRRATPLLADIGEPEDVAALYARVEAEHGRLDVLVNNAAAPQGADRADIEDVPVEVWSELIRVNLTGSFLMCRGAVPIMRRRRHGRIVNIASMAAVDAAGRSAAYSASKAGVLGLTRSLAMDVAGWGITVNAVCPGLVGTSRAMLGRRDEQRDEAMARMSERIPVGRVGTPTDVAGAVAWLADESTGYVTAQALPLNGGGFSPFPLGRPEEARPAAAERTRAGT